MNGFSALLTIFDNGMKKRTQIQWTLYWESRKKENDNNNNKEMKKSRASIKELRILESHMCANLTHLHAPANSIRFYSKSCFVPIFKRFFPLKANVQMDEGVRAKRSGYLWWMCQKIYLTKCILMQFTRFATKAKRRIHWHLILVKVNFPISHMHSHKCTWIGNANAHANQMDPDKFFLLSFLMKMPKFGMF